MAKKERILPYTYTSLFGKYEYETILKGKTLTVTGKSTVDDFEFKVNLIDTGEAYENVEKLDVKIKALVKKFKKSGNIKNLLKYDLIKDIYDKCSKQSKFINNFQRLGSTSFMFKKRINGEVTPSDGINYYFINDEYINSNKKEIKKFLKNLENDKITNNFDGSTLLCNDNYFIMRITDDFTKNQLSLVIDAIDNNNDESFEKLTPTWKKYYEKIKGE